MSDTLVKLCIGLGLALLVAAPWLLANKGRGAREDSAAGEAPSSTVGGDGPPHPHSQCADHGGSAAGHAGADGGGCGH